MCGIVGYVGNRQAAPLLVEGLQRLEYRGYDSAGMATISGKLHIRKDKGKIGALAKTLNFASLPGTTGIAHTRWATHGKPSQKNAHPHLDCKKSIALVHNGIIENFSQLREQLKARGHVIVSDTDSELIAHLIEEKHNGCTLEEAVEATLPQLEGTYALAVVSGREPGKIVVARQSNPIVLGVADGGMFVASDALAFLSSTNRSVFLENGELAVLTPDSFRVFRKGKEIKKEIQTLAWNPEQAKKNGYPHFMIKEIMEEHECALRVGAQPEAIQAFADGLAAAKRVVMVGAGTSRHAALIGRYILMKEAKLYCDVILASEFNHFVDSMDEDTVVLAISQSGETADVMEAIQAAKEKGAKIFSVVNVVGSLLTRDSDKTVYLHAGPEMSVVATKTYVSQLLVFVLLAYALKGKLAEGVEAVKAKDALIQKTLEQNSEVTKRLARKFRNAGSVYFIGRGINFATAVEGALKLKEISYVHGEGMPAGELKHGTLSLIEKGVPIIIINPKDETYHETISNAMEVRARDGFLIGVTDDGHLAYDEVFRIPQIEPIFYPLFSILPLQLFAYYMTLERKLDPDRPRSLAKAVTVK